VILDVQTHSLACSKKLRLLLKDCAQGFYQQMYFLGKDVTHKNGNLLVQSGFVKSPSQGLKGTSCYTLETDHQTIELYGSCACLYTRDSKVAFIRLKNRFYHWLPERRCIAGRWTDDDLEAGTPESIYQSLIPLLRWWLGHEAWIAQHLPPSYRNTCYKEWKKVNSSKSWLPPAVALDWVQGFIEQGAIHPRAKNYIDSL